MGVIPISKRRQLVGTTNPGINLNKCGTWNGTTSRATFTIPATFDPANLPDFTVAFWCNFSAIGANTFGNILGVGFGGIFYNGSTNAAFQVYHSTITAAQFFNIPLNGWHRVLCTWSDSDPWNAPHVFVDAAESIAVPTQKSGTRSNVSGGQGGLGSNNTNNNQTITGNMDQIDIWNRVLTYDEIVDDYYFAKNISGKVFSLPMDEPSGNYIDTVGGVSVSLTSVTQNVASYNTASVIVPARTTASNRVLLRDFGTCLQFLNDADYVNLGNNFNTIFNGLICVSMWICPNSLNQTLFGKEKGVSGFDGYSFGLSNGQVSCNYVTTLNTNDFIANTTTAINAPIGQWTHLGLVYNNRVFKCYVNGVSQAVTVSRNGLVSSTTSTAVCNIGNRNNSDGNNINFSGLIDDVRIFTNVEITLQQFQDIYYRNLMPQGTTLAGWYKFDEGSGTTAIDSSGNNINGTINGATYTTNIFLKPRPTI